jgi:uncharacterized damage-inducible protein DinB
MKSPLAKAWRVNGALDLRLLAAMPEKALGDRFSPRTRTVAAQFAHIHNVRAYHLDKRAPAAGSGIRAFPRGAEPTRKELVKALRASESAIAELLEKAEADGKVKGWPGPPAVFLGYLVSHESHHRGQILVSLRVSGTEIPREAAYGLWDDWRKLSAE